MDFYEKTLSTETVYTGTIIKVERLTVELPNGNKATRDIVRNHGAAVVIPIVGHKIILVQQYRKAADRTFLELPAGKLESNEHPSVCAKRELKEETGYEATTLEEILTLYPAPAFADEALHIFLALDPIKGQPSPDVDEFISAKAYKITDVLNMIDEGIINDSKTVAGVLFAARKLGIK